MVSLESSWRSSGDNDDGAFGENKKKCENLHPVLFDLSCNQVKKREEK